MTSWTAEPKRRVCSKPEPELDALDDVDAHDRGGQRRIEPAVPVDVRPESDREPVDDDLEDAADGVAGRPRLVDPGDHRGLGVGVRAAQRGVVGLVPRAGAVGRIDRHATDLGGERPGLDPELAQERAGDAAGRDARRRLARRGALEHVADVVEAVLEGAGEVGVTGSHAGDRGRALVALDGRHLERRRRLVVERLDGHHLRPVLPVAIADEEQDRRAEGGPVPDAGHDLGAVLLDRLARAAAVAALPPGEVDRQLVGGQGEPRRDALDDRAERLAVRFARGQEAEGTHRRLVPVARSVPTGRSVGRGRGGRDVVRGDAGRLALGRAQPAGARLGELCLHQVERCRLAGPQRERGGTLVEQHQLAVGDGRTGRRRVAAGGWVRA